MKKISTLTVIALILSLSLVGCGKKQKEQAQQEAQARQAAEAKAAAEAQKAKAAEATAKAAEDALKQTENKVQDLSTQLETAQQNVKKMQAQKDQIAEQNQKLEQMVDTLKKKVEDVAVSEGTINEMKSSVKSLQSELGNVKQQRDELRQTVDRISKQRDEAMEKIESLQNQNQSLQQQINELRQMLEEQKKKVSKAKPEPGKQVAAETKKSEPAMQQQQQETETQPSWSSSSSSSSSSQQSMAPETYDDGSIESFEDFVNALTFDITLDYYTHYVWRGQELNESSFQPGAAIAFKNFTAGFWGNIAWTDAENALWQFTEVDWSLDYTDKVPGMDGVNWSVGAIYYNFATTKAADTTELYWGFSFDVPLSPYVMVYHDLDQADGMYINTGISYAWEDALELIPDSPMDLELSASFGWGDGGYNNYYWGVDDDGLNDFNLSLAMPMEIAGGWTMTPSLNWTAIVDNTLRDTDTYDNDDNHFYVGVGLAKSF